MSRLSCVRKTLCPEFCAFKTANVQTFVHSKGKLVRSKIYKLCVYVQTIVRSKDLMSRISCVQNCLCPDFCVFQTKNRPLQNWYSVRFCRGYPAFKRPYVGILVHSNLPMSGLLCVPNQKSSDAKLIFCAFLSRLFCFQKSSCPDFCTFKNAYIQTFVRSKGKLVRSKIDNLCVHVQTIVRSKDLMSRLLCIQNWLCPNFRAFERKVSALQNW